MVSLIVAVVLAHTPVHRPAEVDLESALAQLRVRLDSPEISAQMFGAMAMAYRYGVTQMPCQAQQWQPERGWKAAREPSGRIQWLVGPVAKVRWGGIYGTCFIQSPIAREALPERERATLECECNGWLPSR